MLNYVIPLGFEPKTHSLEGCCSNPTELRNLIPTPAFENFSFPQAYLIFATAKVILFCESTKYFANYFAFYFILLK